MQRTSRNEDPHRLDFAHFTSLENIPTYTIIFQLCQPPASLVTDKTPPFLPEVLVDLLASGPDLRPPLHPQPEVGGKFWGLGSQQSFRKLKLLWEKNHESRYEYNSNSYPTCSIVHSFEYTATFLDMLSNTVWTKKTHIHTFHSHQNYACRILQITDAPNPHLDPCNVLQEMKIHIACILHISHPLKTYQYIPSYTNYVNPPCITCNRQDSTVSSRGSCGSAGIWCWFSTAASSTAWSWGKIFGAGVAAEVQEA